MDTERTVKMETEIPTEWIEAIEKKQPTCIMSEKEKKQIDDFIKVYYPKGYSGCQIADICGKSDSFIAKRINMLKQTGEL